MTVAPVAYQGCPWPIDTSCIPEDWETFDEAVRAYAVSLASSSLHTLTAGRVGGCPIVLRPCKKQSACLPAYGDVTGPYNWMSPGIRADGLWINSCGCMSACGHGSMCEIRLPAPVGEILSIKIDGMEQTLTNFRVDNGNLLVYQGGGDCVFPSDQDQRLPDTEVGTWSVTYYNSLPVDLLAARAAAKMAYEFAVACAGNFKKCRLPASVTAIVRTGVTMELAQGIWPNGFVGIEEIDAWLATVNPHQRKSQTRIYSPDIAPDRIQGRVLTQTTWDGGGPGSSGGESIDGGAP
jgi:hypothetical protein